jgi:hypothetical protein
MKNLTDNLRTGLAALAEEVEPVDLHDRALRTSRRLAVRRTAIVAVAGGLAAGLITTGVAFALPLQGEAPPPLSTVAPSNTMERPTHAPVEESTEPTEEVAGPEIPTEAMLQAEDLGPGYETSDDTSQDHGSLSMLMAYCDLTSGEDNQLLDTRLRAFSAGDDASFGQQEASRYEGDGARTAFMDMSGWLADCPHVEVGGNPEYVSELTVIESGFAGEESLLLEEVYSTPDGTVTRYQAVVQQGDLYSEVRLPGVSADWALTVATAMAERLCEATTAC